MIIAIGASANSLSSAMDLRFGRAKGFILYNTETKQYRFIDNNQNLESNQGAGIQSAQKVINEGAEVLISGHCGPKAFKVLSASDIQIYLGTEGTVKEQIEKFLNGELSIANAPDVEGHW